jgi:hypothetical protein
MQKIISLKKTARLAGILYLVLGLTGFYAIIYVPKQIIVKGDANATVNNLLSHAFLFRTAIASHLVSVITFLLMALVLYKLLKQINKQQARMLVVLVAVQVPIVFLLETFNMTSLMILEGKIFTTATPSQLQDLSILFLKIHGWGIMMLEIFWGLWLIPFGQLVYRSIFIPRVLGVLLIAAGIGYTVDSLTFILFPAWRGTTQITALIFSACGELSIILWLLIRGAREHLSITIISEAKTKPRTGKLQEQAGSL